MKTAYRNRKRSHRRTRRLTPLKLVLAVLLSAVFLVALFLSLRSIFPKSIPEPEVTEAPEYAAGDDVQEDVIFYNETAIPIDGRLDKNTYDINKFYDDGNYTYYDAEDAVVGIDVSVYQGEIDWSAVAGSGIDFVIIRAGYRGAEGSGIEADENFTQNITGALEAGLDVGVYFYSQALTAAEAEEEADFVLSMIADYDISYPVFFDWEVYESSFSRSAAADDAVVDRCAQAFCSKIRAAGYTPGVYLNLEQGYFTYSTQTLAKFDVWFAQYDAYPEFYYNFQMWQYSCTGTVPGIEYETDLNICFSDYRT